jgi:hypothetical protein
MRYFITYKKRGFYHFTKYFHSYPEAEQHAHHLATLAAVADIQIFAEPHTQTSQREESRQ